MIEELKPYSDYQNVDSRWIPRAPSHWEVKKLRALTTPRSERNRPELPLLSVARERGVFVRTEDDDNHNFVPDDLSNYKVAHAGSLVINKMKAWQGSMGIAPTDGIVSPAYFVYDLRISNRMFGQALLRSRPYVAHFAQASDGVRVGQWDLSINRTREIPVLLPPPDEQAAIVRFLDYANLRIDQFIRSKKRLIALLNEQKQAIIHRVVTRGLDASVKLKDSGVPWLGEVPAHWKVLRAKYLYREVDERTATGAEELLSVSHITGVTPRSAKNVTMFKAASYAGHKLCRPGDLVINTMWAWMAALGVSRFTGIVSPAYAVYRPLADRALVDNYADAVLRIRPYVSNYIVRSTGIRSSRLRLYPDQFFRVPLIVPPREEQQKIVEHFSESTAGLSGAIAQAERELALIREYRTRLVADVVTGLLDVRAAAAGLPAVEPEAKLTESEGDETDIEDGEAA